MEIYKTKNRAYPWYHVENIHFRGYIQTPDGVFRDERAAEHLSNISSLDELMDFLKSVQGLFSIIIDNSDSVLAAVDIYRSMPIYFSSDCKIISDDSDLLKKKLGTCTIGDLRLLELYSTGCIAFENTMYKEIKQVSAGCCVEISGNKIHYVPYYSHVSRLSNLTFKTREEAISELERKTEQMVSRVKKVVGGNTIYLSLSGGYDSRYIAMAFKKFGLYNVVCFSYGIEESFEIETAKIIASTLGFKHIVIYQDKDEVLSILKDDDLFEYCLQHDYGIYLQNYVATKRLLEQGNIKEGSYVATGIFNDAPAGFYVPEDEKLSRYELTNEGCAKFVVDERFAEIDINKKAREAFVRKVVKVMKARKLAVTDRDSFVHVANSIMIETEHTRKYWHMNTIHERFNLKYIAPAMDVDLFDFWYGLPKDYLLHRNLYEEYITEYLGKEFGLTMKRTANVAARNPLISKLKRKVGGLLVRTLYTRGIPFNRNTDINGFHELEAAVAKNIVQKKAINYEHANLGHLITIYLMEQRYGHNWYGRISKMIR